MTFHAIHHLVTARPSWLSSDCLLPLKNVVGLHTFDLISNSANFVYR